MVVIYVTLLLVFPLVVSEVNVYTWGSNSNLTLGHHHSRNYPERLDLHGSYTITQVMTATTGCFCVPSSSSSSFSSSYSSLPPPPFPSSHSSSPSSSHSSSPSSSPLTSFLLPPPPPSYVVFCSDADAYNTFSLYHRVGRLYM